MPRYSGPLAERAAGYDIGKGLAKGFVALGIGLVATIGGTLAVPGAWESAFGGEVPDFVVNALQALGVAAGAFLVNWAKNR